MDWPTKEEVEKADRFQLAVWDRFLPLCETGDQVEVVNLVFSRFTAMGGFDPSLSKQVGLDRAKYDHPDPNCRSTSKPAAGVSLLTRRQPTKSISSIANTSKILLKKEAADG
jgi:hypothetical protein